MVFDSKKENAFIVDIDEERTIKFQPNKQGLYTYSPLGNRKPKKEMIMLGRTNQRAGNTPRKKKIVRVEGFTRRELERAKRARRFYHQMGAQALP